MDTEKEGREKMRSFITTIVLLVLMFSAAGVNFIYVNHVADTMEKMTENLPSITEPSCVEKTTELCEEWEKNAPFVGLTVGFLTVDKLTEQTLTLLSCAESGDVYGYHTALAILKDAIDDMHRLEKFSVENLF